MSKPNIRHKTLLRLLGLNKSVFHINVSEFSQLYGDIFNLYLTYRNLTAHGGRVFNYRSKKHPLRKSPLIYNTNGGIKVSNRAFNTGKYRSSIGIVIYTLMSFGNKRPSALALTWIVTELKNYLKKYPQDKSFLIDAMEFDVISELADEFGNYN